mgnify:CR=1 FL=1
MEDEDILKLVVAGFGAGTKGTIAGWLKSKFPQLGISEDLIGAIIGLLLWKFGDKIHPLVKTFGVGVLIGAIGQFTSTLIQKSLKPPTTTETKAGTYVLTSPALQVAYARYGKVVM